LVGQLNSTHLARQQNEKHWVEQLSVPLVFVMEHWGSLHESSVEQQLKKVKGIEQQVTEQCYQQSQSDWLLRYIRLS